jgi:hypothetical protein
MSNPQHTMTISLGVGIDGERRRKAYDKAAGPLTLGQWARDVLDEAAKKELAKKA